MPAARLTAPGPGDTAPQEHIVKPTLIVNPAADRVFAAFAAVLVEHGASSTGDLERRLHTIYPKATVHLRELTGERVVIWYVYRDGRWVDPRAVMTSAEGERQSARSDRGPSIDRRVDTRGR
ncbi:MAG TPA: hypothetical protein VGQ89_05060 [Candidatus Limnocylindrales bacterium]|nr:hypothetical protein [Candidatus Limnocylindrales bacterium]